MWNSQTKKSKTYLQTIGIWLQAGGTAQSLKARHTTKNIRDQRGYMITLNNFEIKFYFWKCPS